MYLFLFFILSIVIIKYFVRLREGLDSLDCSSAEKSNKPSLTCKKEDGNLNSNWVTGALKGFSIAAGFETESTPAYLPGTNPYNEDAGCRCYGFNAGIIHGDAYKNKHAEEVQASSTINDKDEIQTTPTPTAVECEAFNTYSYS